MGVKSSRFAPSMGAGHVYGTSGLVAGEAGGGRYSDGDCAEYAFLMHRDGFECAWCTGALDHGGMRHGFYKLLCALCAHQTSQR